MSGIFNQDIYVRMLSIAEDAQPDWDAAQALFTEIDDPDLDQDAVAQFRYAIEHPDETGLRSFPFRGVHVYLAAADPNAPTGGYAALNALFETGVPEAAGFEQVATA